MRAIRCLFVNLFACAAERSRSVYDEDFTRTSFFGEVLVAEVLPSIFFIVFDPFLNFFLVVWVRSYIHVQ